MFSGKKRERGTAAISQTRPDPNDAIDDKASRPHKHKSTMERKKTSQELRERILSFSLVGGFVTIIGFAILYVLVQYVGLNKNLAYLIQAILSIELNFFLNHFYTWSDRRKQGVRAFVTSWGKFHFTRIFTVTLNQVLYSAFLLSGINYLVASAMCILIVMIINYIAGDIFVFRHSERATATGEVRTPELLDLAVVSTPRLKSILLPRIVPRITLPAVSVIIPVDQDEDSIEATVASLQQQDYPGSVEIILVGNKDDNSWLPLRTYIEKAQLTVIEAQRNGAPMGNGAKRIAGIRQAHGQVMAFTDAGAILPTNWVSMGVEYIHTGWPCVVGETKGLDKAVNTKSVDGHVLDLERFGRKGFLPPAVANLFLAGDILPYILPIESSFDDDPDYVEWIWNLAQADIAIFQTPRLANTFQRKSGIYPTFQKYADNGQACSNFYRRNPSISFSRHQKALVAGTALTLTAFAAILALGITGFADESWLNGINLPGFLSMHAIAQLPLGILFPLALVICELAVLVCVALFNVFTHMNGRSRNTPSLFKRLSFAVGMLSSVPKTLDPAPRGHNSPVSFAVLKSQDLDTYHRLVATPDDVYNRTIMLTGPISESGNWPSVTVVIPVKSSQKTILQTVQSLLHQNYPGPIEILLVGDQNDPTWEPIQSYINDGRVTVIEATIQSTNRDANAKRSIGLKCARGEILALTDSDMVLPEHWVSTGVQYIVRGWPCVAGPMRGASGTFWDAYADLVSLGSKTPRFVTNHVVDFDRFGIRGHKPPITANVFFTRRVLDRVGDPDPAFVHSYEDYSWFWDICQDGFPIFCTPALQADHYHRQGWGHLVRQYTRSGRGCADFVTKYPDCPFSSERKVQLFGVVLSSLAIILGTLGCIIASFVPPLRDYTLDVSRVSLPLIALLPAALVVLIFLYLLGLGFLNAINARQFRALIFPVITLLFGYAFSYGMLQQLVSKTSQHGIAARLFTKKAIITGILFVVVLSGGAALRFWSISTRTGYEWDEPVYTSVAADYAHFGIVEYKAPYGRTRIYLSQPPFYFIVLGNWFRLVGSGITQARLFSGIMSLLTITVLFLYLHQRMGRWALLPTLLVSIDGWLVYANRISWIDNSVVFFGILSLWAYYNALKTDKYQMYILTGLALGFTFVFKQLGVYFCAVPALNWLLSRQRTRGHLTIVGTIGGCAIAYVIVMSIIYTIHGQNIYIEQTLSQVFRSTGTSTSRGTLNSVQEIFSALVGQYRIFIFTILLCVASVAWLAVDVIRSLVKKDVAWLRRYSLEASWIFSGMIVFVAIQIKFPNYFIYLMIPLFIYLTMRIVDVVRPLLAAGRQHPKLVRAGLFTALALLIGIELVAFDQRIVVRNDNALLQVASYVHTNIPSNVMVLADEPIGVMIPQRYCKLENAATCPNPKYIITYISLTEHLPTQASDTRLYYLLAHSTQMVVFTGFKETITVYEVNA